MNRRLDTAHGLAWLALGLLLAAGCDRSSVAQTAPAASTAPSPPAGSVATLAGQTVLRVTAGKLPRKTLELVTVQPAAIEAFEESPLCARIPGYVEAVLVDIGQRVKKDQVLVRLSVPEMEDDVRQKEALVAQAQAEVDEAKATVRAAQAGLATAEAKIRQAEASIARAEADHAKSSSERTRISRLAAEGSVTERLAEETVNQLHSAEAARQEAAAAVESAKAGSLQIQADAEKAQAEQATAEARFRVAQADLARSKTMLAYAQIRAPFDGVVTRRYVHAGHYVEPSSGGPLLVVAASHVVRVFLDVPELEAPWVHDGDPATVSVQALHAQQFQGKVTRTSWSLDPSNRSLKTEIDLANADGVLRPGMYAMASVLLERRENALALPATAVLRDGDKAFCYTVAGGRAVRKPVTLGMRSGDDYEVLEGLHGDETVVLKYPETLSDGQPVEPVAPETI